jgi:hypothetical protein
MLTDANGDTSMHFAVAHATRPIITTLVNYGADPNAPNNMVCIGIFLLVSSLSCTNTVTTTIVSVEFQIRNIFFVNKMV